MSDIAVFERQTLSLTLIEKELYQIYSKLAEKVEDISTKTLLSYIASDSLKHSKILTEIIDAVDGSKVRKKDCDTRTLYNKKLIKALSKDILKRKTVNQHELISLIDTLCGFEVLLFNEYKRAFHLIYSPFTNWDSQKNDETELSIFKLIVNDEELHKKILLSLTKLRDNRLTFKDDAPIIKYQSPDSWHVLPIGGS